jgi:hypothetical protein
MSTAQLGFREEGLHRKAFRCGLGELHDVCYMAIMAEEYRYYSPPGATTRLTPPSRSREANNLLKLACIQKVVPQLVIFFVFTTLRRLQQKSDAIRGKNEQSGPSQVHNQVRD